jgi:hypothetical protein
MVGVSVAAALPWSFDPRVLAGAHVTTKAAPMAGREYRLSKHALEVGLVTVSLFGVMGVVSVTAAILNPDGSFRHPVAAAVTFGILWSCFVLLGVWLILIFARHRLFVDPTTVRVTGCFVSRQISLAKVTHAAWKSTIKHGTLVLKEPSSVVKIGFGNYTFQERLELIRFFRDALAGRDEGWERFESRCMPPQVDYMEVRSQIHGLLRFAAIAWAAAIPFMFAILIWAKLAGGLPNGNWFVVAILPLAIPGVFLGMMWLAARGDLARATSRRDPR